MKTLTILVAMFMTLSFLGCDKSAGEDSGETISVNLEVTDIADNCATIKAYLTSGNFYGAKLLESMNADDVTFDSTNDIQLINYVEKNGEAVDLPLERKLTGVKVGKDMFTAIIVYDRTNRVVTTKTVTWTPEGKVDGWSDENNPGELEEIEW